MCCAGNGYTGQRVEGRGPDGQLTVQGVVRAYFVRNHGDGPWIIAKGVLSRCASTALVLCIALSRVLR
jgi:hypothetical protein